MNSEKAAVTGPNIDPSAPPRAGLMRPHQSSCEARPNCQCATSMGDARMSQRPWGRLEIKKSGGHGRCGLRARENAADGNSLRFKLLPVTFITTLTSALCQAKQCETLLSSLTFLPALTLAQRRSIRPLTSLRRRLGAIPRWPDLRLVDGSHWPVTMIDGFPPPAAAGGADPGVQIGEPAPPPAADSGVQISPRVAATPSCPLAVVTRGPY